MITIKELANELHTDKQTIHRCIKKHNIETIQNGNKMFLDDTNKQRIIELLTQKTYQKNDSETIQNDSKNDSKNDFETILDTLIKELQVKNEQIQTLNETIKTQLEMIQTLTEQNSKQAQLIEQAHTLHYIDIVKPDSEPKQTTQRTQQQAHKPQQAKPQPQERKQKPKENIFDSILKRFRK